MSVAALQRGDLQTIVESSVQFGVFVRRPAFTGWRAFKSRNRNLGELLWLCWSRPRVVLVVSHMTRTDPNQFWFRPDQRLGFQHFRYEQCHKYPFRIQDEYVV